MQNSSPNKHAIWSPSGAEKWVNCPGSIKLESEFPNESSEFSDEGTAAHFLASYCLLLKQNPVQHLGREIKFFVGENGDESVDWFIPLNGGSLEELPGHLRKSVTVTQEMVANIDMYISEVQHATGSGYAAIELQLSIGHITGEPGAVGTADIVIVEPGRLHVRDLKYGKGVQVWAKNNKQLVLYALAAYDTYKDAPTYILDELTEIVIAIHQPRLNHMDEWTITVPELLELRERYSIAAKQSFRVLEGKLPVEDFLTPGLHCSKGFCRAQATCPALKQYVLDSCGFEDVTDAMKDLDLTADELGDSKNRIPILKAWIKKVEEEAYKRLERGDAVTGYKLVQGRAGNRTWADEQQAVAELSTLGYTLAQLYENKLKSPTALKEQLKMSKQRFKELEPLIHRSAPGRIVVPETDGRSAQSNTDGFENIEES